MLRDRSDFRRVDFARVAEEARARATAILSVWLPDGRTYGREFVARNPRRRDARPGSFRVNITTGRWSDFATGDRGGDLVSLAAYLHGDTQREAAIGLARMMGVSPFVG